MNREIKFTQNSISSEFVPAFRKEVLSKKQQPLEVQKEEQYNIFYKLNESDLDYLAKKYNADKEILRKAAYLRGAFIRDYNNKEKPLTFSDYLNKISAEVSENLFFNLPQYGTKKLLPENEKRAIDELSDIISSRETFIDKVIDFTMSLPSTLLVPAAAGAKISAQAGLGAIAGAIQGIGTSKEGEELKSAATGAAIGGTLSVIVGSVFSLLGGKKNKELIKEKVKDLFDPIQEFHTIYQHSTKKQYDPFKQAFLDYLNGRQSFVSLNQFSRHELGIDTNKVISEFTHFLADIENEKLIFKNYKKFLIDKLKVHGEQYISNAFDNYIYTKDFLIFATEHKDTLIKKELSKSKNFLLNFVDNRVRAGIYEERYKIDLVSIIDDLSDSHKRYTILVKSWENKINELNNILKDKETNDKIFKAISYNIDDNLSRDDLLIIKYINNFFDSARKEANKLGLNIQEYKRGSGIYLPRRLIPIEESVIVMKEKLEEFKRKYNIDLENVVNLKLLRNFEDNKEFADILNAVHTLTGLDKNELLSNNYIFTKAIKSTIDIERAPTRFELSATAAFKRKDIETPEFLIEKDIVRLAKNWIMDTFKSLSYRDALARLHSASLQAAHVDAADVLTFINNLRRDLHGHTSGLADVTTKALMKAKIWGQTSIKEGRDNVVTRVISKTPDIYTFIVSSVYKNLLGWNIPTALINLFSPLVVGYPYLGYGYGLKKLVAAYGDAARTIIGGKTIKLIEPVAKILDKKAGDEIRTSNLAVILRNENVIGENWNLELADFAKTRGFTEDPQILKITGKSLQLIDNINELGMTLFSASEVLNRYTMNSVAKQITEDLLNNNKKALEFINSGLSTHNVAKIKTLLSAISDENYGYTKHTINKIIADEVLANTMFNYDKATMSQLGRWIGPGLSLFLKWPTTIVGDVAYILHKKQKLSPAVIELGRKYLTPLAALGLIDWVFLDSDTPSESYKFLLGEEGASRAAAISSVKDLLTLDILKTQPLLKITTGLVKSTSSLEPDKLYDWASDTYRVIGPGAGFMKFLTIDIPYFIEGVKPKGDIPSRLLQEMTGNKINIKEEIKKLYKEDKKK